MGLVACAAIALIALLVGAFVATQFGPGGLMSDVRPGAEAPDFEVPTLGGESIKLSDYRGRPVVLNFWATWCPPCIVEIPLLVQAEADYADENLALIALNAGQTSEHIRSFFDEQGIDMPVALDPGKDVYELYGVVGLPTTVWIDRDGVVSAVELGVLTPELIDGYMSELLEPGR
jgi:peroxiredoxin